MNKRVKVKSKKVKYRPILGPFRMTVEYEGDSDTNCSWCTWNGHEMLRKKTSGTENSRKNRNHLDHCIVKIS